MNRATSGLSAAGLATDRIGLLCTVLAAVGFSGKAILVKGDPSARDGAGDGICVGSQAFFWSSSIPLAAN